MYLLNLEFKTQIHVETSRENLRYKLGRVDIF